MSIFSALKGGKLRSPQSIRHNGKKLSDILETHALFTRGAENGVRADLSGADLSHADLGKARLAYVDFRGANLEGANLREARLASADLSNANLQRADLRKADLTEANLAGANLTEAQAGGAELFRADLGNAILKQADFGATNFREANVQGANFDGACMRTAILRETKLDGVDLSRVDLTTALMPRGYSAPNTANPPELKSLKRSSTRKSMELPLVSVEDYKLAGGWANPRQCAERATAYCEMLERGEILFFREPPFNLPVEDRTFLVTQQWTELRMHKNISYRPSDDSLRGVSGDAATANRMHEILSSYSSNTIGFLKKFLAPYAEKWTLDFASFRPFEEQNRGLPLHKRNDLLHVDAFPSRPTRGGRILRVFTNVNPSTSRIWQTTEGFERIARRYADDAGLRKIAGRSFLSRTVQDLGGKLGFRGMGRTPYDTFMLTFHDYLKENTEFQRDCPKVRLEFPPLATWLVLTDGVAHAAMSGQYALEQTLLIPPNALVSPQNAPYRILENIAGQSLVS